MKRRGVNYDVGRVMMGELWRPTFDPKMVHRELEIIKNDLYCNAVRICGLDLDRLMTASEDALKQGLESLAFAGDVGQKPGRDARLPCESCSSSREAARATIRNLWCLASAQN